MQAYLVAKLVKGYVLIISSGHEYRLLLERVESCCGACGACSDGVVYKCNSVEYPHLLEAVLDAGKALCYGYADVIVNISVRRGKSRHIVFKIMRSGQLDIVGSHDLII